MRRPCFLMAHCMPTRDGVPDGKNSDRRTQQEGGRDRPVSTGHSRFPARQSSATAGRSSRVDDLKGGFAYVKAHHRGGRDQGLQPGQYPPPGGATQLLVAWSADRGPEGDSFTRCTTDVLVIEAARGVASDASGRSKIEGARKVSVVAVLSRQVDVRLGQIGGSVAGWISDAMASTSIAGRVSVASSSSVVPRRNTVSPTWTSSPARSSPPGSTARLPHPGGRSDDAGR